MRQWVFRILGGNVHIVITNIYLLFGIHIYAHMHVYIHKYIQIYYKHTFAHILTQAYNYFSYLLITTETSVTCVY